MDSGTGNPVLHLCLDNGLIHSLSVQTRHGISLSGVWNMAHLEFSEAFRANPYIFVFIPIAIPYWLFKTHQYIKTGETKYSKIEIVFIAVALVSAIAFGIMRNIH